jgi:periplasmic divalent cation tolerance protein
MTKYNWVYMTAGDMEEARAIGRFLVESRLAACVNIIDNMKSLYWWEGEVQEDEEVILIAKTVNVKVPELIDKVKAMHSYECPCILALPISTGNVDFFKWLDTQTSSLG